MIFKEMDPAVVLEALKGQTNILGPEVERTDTYFASLQCPYCGGSVRKFVDPSCLFAKDSYLPKFLAECNDCGCQFEPYTKIELRGPQTNPLDDDQP